MTIGTMCKHDVVCIAKNASIQEAAKLMNEKNIGSLIVTEDQNPVGILTDRDIVTKLVAEKTDLNQAKVEEIMNKDVLTVQSDQGFKKVLTAMKEKGVRRAPIIENNKICGIVSLDDVLMMMVTELNDVATIVQQQVKTNGK